MFKTCFGENIGHYSSTEKTNFDHVKSNQQEEV